MTGVDIDPQAVAASRGNALLNHCETKVEFHTAHFGAQADPRRAAEVVDVVVANILANPLIMLAPILTDATRAGGQYRPVGHSLRASGRGDACLRQYFNLHIAQEQAGWVLLTGTKN